VIDVVGERDLAQQLAHRHALQGFALLVFCPLRLAAEPRALGVWPNVRTWGEPDAPGRE
jgi:hypothetical protein